LQKNEVFIPSFPLEGNPSFALHYLPPDLRCENWAKDRTQLPFQDIRMS
jgi:hypothetical protein